MTPLGMRGWSVYAAKCRSVSRESDGSRWETHLDLRWSVEPICYDGFNPQTIEGQAAGDFMI